MAFLRAIGRFFARIGRWIRDTAWVQPLLIVGGIFAIIFSIPYISTWVKSWFEEKDAGEVYYKDRTVSCEGAKENNSDAEKLLSYMSYSTDNPVEGFAEADYNTAKSKYGEKFFLMFGYEGCPGCATLYDGFSTATNEWKSEFGMTEDYKFWFIDVKTVDTKGDSLFASSADYSVYSKFSDVFTKANKVGNSSYYIRHTSDRSSYENNLNSIGNAGGDEDFITPTIFVVDLTANSQSKENYGISEVFFNVPTADLPKGENTTLTYIEFLTQAWTSTGVFSESGRVTE